MGSRDIKPFKPIWTPGASEAWRKSLEASEKNHLNDECPYAVAFPIFHEEKVKAFGRRD